MTELSPAVQAVLDAFTEDNCLHDWKHNHYNIEALAAALRAAADQADPKHHVEDISYQHQLYVDGWKDCLEVIRDIANELNGDSNV
jgi:hypothetical protein